MLPSSCSQDMFGLGYFYVYVFIFIIHIYKISVHLCLIKN